MKKTYMVPAVTAVGCCEENILASSIEAQGLDVIFDSDADDVEGRAKENPFEFSW